MMMSKSDISTESAASAINNKVDNDIDNDFISIIMSQENVSVASALNNIMMSQSKVSVASALDNRIITFIDIDNVFNCFLCMQVADDPVRCSVSCAGVFCNGCMTDALALEMTCPSCTKSNITASSDVILRNHILKHQVYCPNKGTDINYEKCTWKGRYDELCTHFQECSFELEACREDGCEEKMERREIEAHELTCVHRKVKCDHCNVVVKAEAMDNHLVECPEMKITCECGFECSRNLLKDHGDKDCPLAEVECQVVCCGAKMERKNYEQHQIESAQHHVRLLSAELLKQSADVQKQSAEVQKLSAEFQKQSTEVQKLTAEFQNEFQKQSDDFQNKFQKQSAEFQKQSAEFQKQSVENKFQKQSAEFQKQSAEFQKQSAEFQKQSVEVQKLTAEIQSSKSQFVQVKWRIADAVNKKRYYSRRFDISFNVNHKLYILAEVQGNQLGLYLCKDVTKSQDKRRLNIGGTSIVVTKAGLPDVRVIFSHEAYLELPHFARGFPSFLADMTPYIDNSGINVVLDIKLSKNDEPIVL